MLSRRNHAEQRRHDNFFRNTLPFYDTPKDKHNENIYEPSYDKREQQEDTKSESSTEEQEEREKQEEQEDTNSESSTEEEEEREKQEEQEEITEDNMAYLIQKYKNDINTIHDARMFKQYISDPAKYSNLLKNYHVFTLQDIHIFHEHHAKVEPIFVACGYYVGLLLPVMDWDIMHIRMLLKHSKEYHQGNQYVRSIIAKGEKVFDDPEYTLRDLETQHDIQRRIARRL